MDIAVRLNARARVEGRAIGGRFAALRSARCVRAGNRPRVYFIQTRMCHAQAYIRAFALVHHARMLVSCAAVHACASMRTCSRISTSGSHCKMRAEGFNSIISCWKVNHS
eukprot:6183461-Pleurochrysis_carterae.AAC.5